MSSETVQASLQNPNLAQVIVSTACKSAGEALREIDVKDVVKSDFVLVSGDVVSNMDLGAAARAHRAHRDRDKGAIMTMVRARASHSPFIGVPVPWALGILSIHAGSAASLFEEPPCSKSRCPVWLRLVHMHPIEQ